MRHPSRASLTLLLAGLSLPLMAADSSTIWNVDLAQWLASCPANGCDLQLNYGVYEVDRPLWIGRLGQRSTGWRIRGRGRGVFATGSQRTNCATTIRYVGPYTDGAVINVASLRQGEIADLCLDLNGRAAGDFEFFCPPSTANCGDFRVAVVSGGWLAGSPGTFGPRNRAAIGNDASWEAVTFDHYQQQYTNGIATMGPPRIGMHLANRAADHWRIQSSKLAFGHDGAGILLEGGNFSLIETIIRSDATSTSSSCALKVASENDRLAIVGLTTELQGGANGVCGCRPDASGACAPAIMAVSISGSEIKVPMGSSALEWSLGGSLAITGTVLGYHGGGTGRIRVLVAPTKRLYFIDNFYRMSLLDVYVYGDVVMSR